MPLSVDTHLSTIFQKPYWTIWDHGDELQYNDEGLNIELKKINKDMVCNRVGNQITVSCKISIFLISYGTYFQIKQKRKFTSLNMKIKLI